MGLRFLTGGESHGPGLTVIVEGMPAGLPLTAEAIDRDLSRRQRGYGRGGRMTVESDRVQIISGVRFGLTLGSPISMMIENRDHSSWGEVMSVVEVEGKKHVRETRPRPGHADLAGMLKYGINDAREVLERASARETAARTAAGAVAKRLLEELGSKIASRVVRIGTTSAPEQLPVSMESFAVAEGDQVRCSDPETSRRMTEEIDTAAADGDSLGGTFEVVVFGPLPGLGSAVQADRRLDTRLCGALASIPGIKGVEVGEGFKLAAIRGSQAHDEIFFEADRGIFRQTNRAGGLEAGMTNGEPIVLRAAMKPIPTLGRPLATVDVETLEPTVAFKERADTCAVPAAAVVGEAVVAFVLAEAVLEKFGSDSMADIKRGAEAYLERIARLWRRED
jgi:chorismate synthase